MGWGGESRASGKGRGRPMTGDERADLRQEMVEVYLAIARDSTQPSVVRMAAAGHLLERLDNPFDPF